MSEIVASSRRTFLRSTAVGIAAAAVAACGAPVATWRPVRPRPARSPSAVESDVLPGHRLPLPPRRPPTPSMTHDAPPSQAAVIDHDSAAKAVVVDSSAASGSRSADMATSPFSRPSTAMPKPSISPSTRSSTASTPARSRSTPLDLTGRGPVHCYAWWRATGCVRPSRTVSRRPPASTSTAKPCRTRWTASLTSPRSPSSPMPPSPTSSSRHPPARTCTTRITT